MILSTTPHAHTHHLMLMSTFITHIRQGQTFHVNLQYLKRLPLQHPNTIIHRSQPQVLCRPNRVPHTSCYCIYVFYSRPQGLPNPLSCSLLAQRGRDGQVKGSRFAKVSVRERTSAGRDCELMYPAPQLISRRGPRQARWQKSKKTSQSLL